MPSFSLSESIPRLSGKVPGTSTKRVAIRFAFLSFSRPGPPPHVLVHAIDSPLFGHHATEGSLHWNKVPFLTWVCVLATTKHVLG